jgi:hypothetical protein
VQYQQTRPPDLFKLMNLLKQYITQTISSASNNLRLSTEKIEVVALLRQAVNQSGNLEEDFKKMKTITELSKFAIKLNEIYNYLTKDQVDFQKLSEKFREHSQYLIKDLSQMLDSVTPASFKILLNKVQDNSEPEMKEKKGDEPAVAAELIQEGEPAVNDQKIQKEDENKSSGNGSIDEEQDFKDQILMPIRPLDDFLKKISSGRADTAVIDDYLIVFKENGIISFDKGYSTVANMHDTIYKALKLFKSGRLKPTKEVTESLRACLIVIATLIRNKAVDITNYLNLAEEFGKKIETIKQEKN